MRVASGTEIHLAVHAHRQGHATPAVLGYRSAPVAPSRSKFPAPPIETLDAMFSNDRQSHRRMFITAWEKAQAGEPLEPVEAQIVQILRQHPEYHGLMSDTETALERDFPPEQGESNPFLHMGLHIAILDQLSVDQPAGIRGLYLQLARTLGDPHEAEHRIMECLAEALWTLQRTQAPFDDAGYLACIKRAGDMIRPQHH
jgi:hypothetical protein